MYFTLELLDLFGDLDLDFDFEGLPFLLVGVFLGLLLAALRFGLLLIVEAFLPGIEWLNCSLKLHKVKITHIRNVFIT